MNIQKLRYVLWIGAVFLLFVLFNAWENDKLITEDFNFQEEEISFVKKPVGFYETKYFSENSDEVVINTNLIKAKINLIDGNISFLALKQFYKDVHYNDNNIVLFDASKRVGYKLECDISERSDLLIYSSYNFHYDIINTEDNLYVKLVSVFNNFIVNKIYTFKPFSYNISLNFFIQNTSNDNVIISTFASILSFNFEVEKNIKLASPEGNSFAVFSETKPCVKIPLSKLMEKSYDFLISGGWFSFVENYFITVIVPDIALSHRYKTDESFGSMKMSSKTQINIFGNECRRINFTFFIGPKRNVVLTRLYLGLDLIINYGIFWPIASPVFMLLNKLFDFVKNWGLSIILITFIVKLLFFYLSSISYKSVGKMKKLQPKINLLKEHYKDDKQEFGKAVLDIYKKEKVNPLSGCLPVLIQIPFFISLYYVFLYSVELRHASFCLWITDLSANDPYYLLPIFMCVTMIIQQKLNPPIYDPLQATIMSFIPFVFLILFLNFPSGLILYWIINNILSIFQQAFIMKF